MLIEASVTTVQLCAVIAVTNMLFVVALLKS